MNVSRGSSPSSRTLPAIVGLRARLLRGLPRHPSWAALEARIADELRAYFDATRPMLLRIDASSPRPLLNWIVKHEAVHAFRALGDLLRRLEADRRCYALVSAAMPDEPLAFTELALTRGVTADVTAILDTRSPVLDPESCDSAMFFSISSCHDGLRGVPFGNLLLRQVIAELQVRLPGIRTFATVSPVPGFRGWINDLALQKGGEIAGLVSMLDDGRWQERADRAARLKSELLPLCASYLLHVKRGSHAHDAVARFHLGNGARLERINWLGDRSAAGLARSAGITANYLYDLQSLDANAAAYRDGTIVAGPQVALLATTIAKPAA